VHGNLGTSISTGRPVAQEIAQTLPITVTLAICSTVLSILAGFSIGILSAAKQGKFADYSATLVTLFGLSMPSFWLGVMLILVFSVKLQWLPTAGWNGALSVILPSVTLGAGAVAVIARMTRSSLLEALSADYVRTARAKGISETWIFLRHALRNALIPSITVIGLEFGILLGGAVITEDVFAIPGLGRLILSAINARDYPTVEGAVLVIGLMFVLVNLVTDILYAVIDPRIRYS
ncbi:MAG: ABC transporter permease, partial [Bacilli bacterium]